MTLTRAEHGLCSEAERCCRFLTAGAGVRAKSAAGAARSTHHTELLTKLLTELLTQLLTELPTGLLSEELCDGLRVWWQSCCWSALVLLGFILNCSFQSSLLLSRNSPTTWASPSWRPAPRVPPMWSKPS